LNHQKRHDNVALTCQTKVIVVTDIKLFINNYAVTYFDVFPMSSAMLKLVVENCLKLVKIFDKSLNIVLEKVYKINCYMSNVYSESGASKFS